MQRIAVIDYGSGNLRSVAKALSAVAAPNEQVIITAAAADIAQADRIVLPGVGAFADCARGLRALPEVIPTMCRRVLEQGVPFLGICVGMQLLADTGYEHETSAGLGWIGGTVRALPRPAEGKIPHMGWNTVRLIPSPTRGGSGRGEEVAPRDHPLFTGLTHGTHMYFVHSYHFVSASPETVLATSAYGQDFAAAIGRDNIVGTQFHPEKSQAAGLRLLRNFLDWQPHGQT